MKVSKVLAPAIIVALLTIMLVAPVYACTNVRHSITKISFTQTLYLVGYTPGETSTKNGIIYTNCGTSHWITLDGTLVSDGKTVYRLFNTATNKGNGLATYVDSYTNDVLIGTGVIKSSVYSKTTVADNSVGISSSVGYGSSDKYSSITVIATSSWHPTATPFPVPTLVLTVTGVFIVKE